MSTWLEKFMSPLARVKKLGGGFGTGFTIPFGEFFLMKKLLEDANLSGVEKPLHISKPAVSQMLGALEKKGYVKREINKTDRRKIQATLTPCGVEMLQKEQERYESSFDEIISSFGEDNASELVRLLSHFADIIEEKREKAV